MQCMGSALRISNGICRLLIGMVAVAALTAASGAAAKSMRLGAGDWRAIQVVIAKQMDAFRLNDGDVAFSLTSPGSGGCSNPPMTSWTWCAPNTALSIVRALFGSSSLRCSMAHLSNQLK